MAIFRLQIDSIARTAGRQATGAAAYRAGEKIRDERTGELHNHSRRKDVVHKEIMLPSQFAGATLEWARDRSRLWNEAERAEVRRDARVAREFQVVLPAELSAGQRLSLARAFSQEVSDRYSIAVDLAVHDPRPTGDPRNFHAHLLATTREVTPTGLGAKAGMDMHARERNRRELPNMSQEFVAIRERWATLTNEALRDAHVDARIDHRSLEAQGIDREPMPRIPMAAFKMERSGQRSEIAERLRAEYSARVQARLERSAPPLDQAAERTNEEQRSAKDVRNDAAKAWLKFRAAQVGMTPDEYVRSVNRTPEAHEERRAPSHESDQQHTDHRRDDDHSL